MKGNPRIIATLNALLADELAARDQYLLHAHKLRRWGYLRLAERRIDGTKPSPAEPACPALPGS